MTTAADTLRTIEMNAERAIVQELRIMIRDVLDLRPSLDSRTATTQTSSC